MQKRSVNRIILAQDIMMGPIALKQPLPTTSMDQIDPFLLLHHAGPLKQEPFERNVMDVGPHPHRGFEPVTFIFKGGIHHKDSRGNDSIIYAGGVQWMTAGMGIIHSESLPKSILEEGGDIEIIQLWINLPKSQKMVQPKYQGFQRDEIPAFIDQDGKVRVNVIAGNFQDLKGPIESRTGITAHTLELKTGGKVRLNTTEDQHILLYQLNGSALVNGIEAGPNKMVTFKQDGTANRNRSKNR